MSANSNLNDNISISLFIIILWYIKLNKKDTSHKY